MIFLLLSCGEIPCTKIGCTDLTTVEILPWSSVFGNAQYQIQIVGDDQSLHDCTIVISGQAPGCDDGGDCVLESTCNASYTAGSWTFISESAPEVISIDVFKDDVNYLSIQTEPVYESISPNGLDCEPTCLIAETISQHLIH